MQADGKVVHFPALKPRKALAEYRLKVTHYPDRVEVEPEGLDDSIENREIVRQLLEKAAWRLQVPQRLERVEPKD